GAAWMWFRSVRQPAVRAGGALAFGLAASSAVFFVWRVVGLSLAAYPAADATLWIVLAIAGAVVERGPRSVVRTLSSRSGLIVGPAALGVGTPAVVLVMRWVLSNPYGRWDAWAIWNLHAKFLAAPSAAWRGMFDAALGWSQPDYPLLLPSAVARGWTFAGSAT